MRPLLSHRRLQGLLIVRTDAALDNRSPVILSAAKNPTCGKETLPYA